MLTAPNRDPLNDRGYTSCQLWVLTVLRIFIGWHLLYEGLVKLFNPYWSSMTYLRESRWIFRGFFRWIADHPGLLKVVDVLNEWGLVLIGLALMLGLFSRGAAIAGAILVFLYWLANPPFIAFRYSMPPEGSYIIVNKNLIEATALLVLALFPTGRNIGLDRLLFLSRKNR